MRKKILSLVLSVAMLVGLFPVSAFAEGGSEQSTEQNYPYLLRVPEQNSSYNIRTENGERFIVYDNSTFTNSQGVGVSSNKVIAAKNLTYGASATGIAADTDLSELASSYIAIRLKINDNSEAYALNNSLMAIWLTTSQSGLSEFRITQNSSTNTLRWLDLNDGSMMTFRPQGSNGNVDFVGNLDGYLLIPTAIYSSRITEEYLKNYYSGIHFYFYEYAQSSSTKASSFKDKEVLVGDCLLVDDIEAFRNEKTMGKVKYAPNGAEDTAYYGLRVAGYLSVSNGVFGSSITKKAADPTAQSAGSGSPVRGYTHITTLPNGDRAYAISLNTDLTYTVTENGETVTKNYTCGGGSISMVNTYESSWGGYRNINDGIPKDDVDLSKMNALVLRIATRDGSVENEEISFTPEIRRQGSAGSRYGLVTGRISQGEIGFIDADSGVQSTLTVDANGAITVEGNIDGFIVVPFEKFGSFFSDTSETSILYDTWGGNANSANSDTVIGATKSEGYGIYLNSGFTNGKTIYAGDIYFVENVNAFAQFRCGQSAGGHTVVNSERIEPTCTEAGITEGTYCSVCHKIITGQQPIEALGHNLVSSTVTPSTVTAGYDRGTCTRCNFEVRDNFVDTLGGATDSVGVGMFRFTGDANNYGSTAADKLAETEDVLAAGYVNTMFIATDDLFEERVALCREYNCKFWTGPGKFDSELETIEHYINTVEISVNKIKAAGAWDLFLGFNWDEPIWNGMSNEEFYTMTKALYEKWGKRNFVVFAVGSFLDGYGANYTTISPEYMTYLTDAGWDHYYYDLRDEALNDEEQNSSLASSNEKYGVNNQTAEDYYRWVNSEMLEKIDHDVNVWFFPAAYSTNSNGSLAVDEGYWLAHLNFFTQLLSEQTKPGGLILYNYSGSVEKPALEQRLPVSSLETGEQRLYPDITKYETYAQRLKEIKLQFDATDVTAAKYQPIGILDVTKIRANYIKYNAVDGFEYSIDGGITYETDGSFTSLTENTQYTIRVREIANGAVRDFSVKTRTLTPYASGLNDGASYALNMQNTPSVYSTNYGWVGYGMSRNRADTAFTSSGGSYLHLKTIEGERFIEMQNNGNEANSAINLAFGDTTRSKSTKGISDEIDATNLTAFAFRIKTTGGLEDQQSAIDLYINSKRTSQTSTYPIKFIDKQTGEISTMTYDYGIKIVGNIDGWIIVPFEAYTDLDGDSTTTDKEWIVSNLSNFQIWMHESDCTNHGASYSRWDNGKTLYFGDVMYIEDAQNFANARISA